MKTRDWLVAAGGVGSVTLVWWAGYLTARDHGTWGTMLGIIGGCGATYFCALFGAHRALEMAAHD